MYSFSRKKETITKLSTMALEHWFSTWGSITYITYFLIQNCFKCDSDHYTVLSVITTITVLMHLSTHE